MNPGIKLGPYQITEKLGEGGMGEVYRATDTRLDRTVAIKVLPEHMASDAQRRERFEREARAVSSLNHPHICTLHDVGEQDGSYYLVMELVEGETLEARMEKGRLPLDKALEYAIQIADALDKAHRKGVVHRDLKPANIMLTKSGVKLLDFGLAKLKGEAAPTSGLSQAPTVNKSLTVEGTILGTLQYMAPEQLEGKEADARTDIFAFGAVVYEMVTGRKAFEGKSQASLIGAIMNSEPQPMAELQDMTPPALALTIRECLAKEPDERWQTAQDLVKELGRIRDGREAAVPASGQSARSYRTLLIVGLGLAAAIALGFWMGRRPQNENPALTRKLALLLAADENTPGMPLLDRFEYEFDMDRQGRILVLNGLESSQSQPQLFVYDFATGEISAIPGTQGVLGPPAVSASGTRVAFRLGSSLYVASLTGGASELTRLPEDSYGIAWIADESILFGSPEGIRQIPASGGDPQLITTVDAQAGELDHRWPSVAGDDELLAYVVSQGARAITIRLRSLRTGQERTLLDGGSPRVTSSDYLVFVPGVGSCYPLAAPIDRETLSLVHTAVPVLSSEGVACRQDGYAFFDVSEDGLLVYSPRIEQAQPIERIGPDGVTTKRIAEGFQGVRHVPFRLSPDGRRLAETRHPVGRSDQVVIHNLEDGGADPLNWESDSRDPIWSSDGTRLTFYSAVNGTEDLFEVAATPGARPELLFSAEGTERPTSWSPDDQELAYTEGFPPRSDVWLYRRGEDKGEPLLNNPNVAETGAIFSPNGRFIAYLSNERGRFDVWILSRSHPERRVPVSRRGGTNPIWSPDSKGIYFQVAGQGIFYATITEKESGLEPGMPVLRVPIDLDEDREFGQGAFDTSDAGRSFVVMRQDPSTSLGLFKVVSDWFGDLERLAPREP